MKQNRNIKIKNVGVYIFLTAFQIIIVDKSVIKYETGKTEKSNLIIYNHINELIGLLTENIKGDV